MNVIDCKTLADLYHQLGASVWCSRTTEGSTAEYHAARAEKWFALINEARPLILKTTSNTIDKQAFRRLLVKYFEDDLLSQVPYIADLQYPGAWLNEELCKEVVEKWVNGEYD